MHWPRADLLDDVVSRGPTQLTGHTVTCTPAWSGGIVGAHRAISGVDRLAA